MTGSRDTFQFVTYLSSLTGLLWMVLVHWVLLVPITLPVTVVGLWLLLKRNGHHRPALPPAVWIPSALVITTLAWAAAFVQPPDGTWSGWQWPGLFGVVALLIALRLSIGLWRTTGDRRVAGLSLLQVWLLVVTAWVAGAAVSPGSGLGAL